MKYKNIKTVVDGITFASKKEADRYKILWTWQHCGEISGLELQKKYELIPKQNRNGRKEQAVHYVADFVYLDNHTKQIVVEDTKGFRTAAYILKRKLMLWAHGIVVKEI